MQLEKQYRTIVLNVRLTDAEASVVKQKAFRAGLQTAVYIREASLSKEIVAPISPEQMNAIRNLNRMAQNLNQLVRATHEFGLERTANDVSKMLNQIKQLLP